MTSYLFDASSIMNLIKKGLIRPLANGVTMDLALYESLNAVWKENRLLKRIGEDTALEYTNIISEIFKVVEVWSIKGLEEEVLNLAFKENLTVYDASYLYMAIKGGFTLVTDDQNLKNKALKHIAVITTESLSSKRA